MTTSEVTSETSTSANSTGVYLAVLQLVFTLGWTTYVIYLPKLCAEVGIAPSAVILILMLDQAIFTITDTAMGIAADKIAPFVGKLGVFVGTLTAISCAAFVALPFVAGTGPGAQVWFIGLILIWVVTSSALRAPPLTLLGKYARAAGDPVSVGAGDARLRAGGRGIALSRRGAAQSRPAAALRDLGRGAAGYHAGALEGRAQSGAGSAGREGTGARKTARPGADVLHRLDGDPVARLSTAFFHQQHAVLPALRQAGRIAMADAGVLDRLQHRDVSGQRRGQAPRRADRDGRRRACSGRWRCWARKWPAISTC